MANTGFKGINVRQTGLALVFRALLQDNLGAIVTSGTTNLRLYELQSDGTVLSYDWNDNTFKSGALTTQNQAMTHRSGNNSTVSLGIWTVALSTLTGFTVGGVYFAVIINSGATPVQQVREFQYGDVEGDASVSSGLVISSNVKRNQALAKFSFIMTDSTNHAPVTGKTVTVTRSIDGAAFGAGTISGVTELSNGVYYCDFAAADLNGKVIVVRATATGCDDTFERIITQP